MVAIRFDEDDGDNPGSVRRIWADSVREKDEYDVRARATYDCTEIANHGSGPDVRSDPRICIL